MADELALVDPTIGTVKLFPPFVITSELFEQEMVGLHIVPPAFMESTRASKKCLKELKTLSCNSSLLEQYALQFSEFFSSADEVKEWLGGRNLFTRFSVLPYDNKVDSLDVSVNMLLNGYFFQLKDPATCLPNTNLLKSSKNSLLRSILHRVDTKNYTCFNQNLAKICGRLLTAKYFMPLLSLDISVDAGYMNALEKLRSNTVRAISFRPTAWNFVDIISQADQVIQAVDLNSDFSGFCLGRLDDLLTHPSHYDIAVVVGSDDWLADLSTKQERGDADDKNLSVMLKTILELMLLVPRKVDDLPTFT